MVKVFISQSTSDETQDAIDAGGGKLIVTVPWDSTKGFEDVASGDDVVIEVSDPEDKSAWIGTVDDVEFEAGYPMTVLIEVR